MTNEQPAQQPASGVEAHLAKHGKIAYVEIPAVDAARSAQFYEAVFGWHFSAKSEQRASFADAPRDLIGALTTEREVQREPGVLLHIYVEGVDAALDRIREHGGEVLEEPRPEGDLWVAQFRDPAGNRLGIWQGEG